MPRIQGVITIPDPTPAAERGSTSARWTNEAQWPASFIRGLKPETLSLAYTVGVPLKYVRWPGPETADRRFISNFFVSMLTTNYDVARIEGEINSGKVAVIGSRNVNGACFLFREDGRPLQIQHVEALALYFTQCLQDVGFCDKFEIATVEELRRRIQVIGPKLGPEQFQAFWDELQRTRVGQGDRDWEGVEQPVTAGVAEQNTSIPGRRRF